MAGDVYVWLKAFHIIAVVAWMAGLLYLPRLFVYHCGVQPLSPQAQTFTIMERRLLRAIMNPAMVLSLALGAALLAAPGMVGLPHRHRIRPASPLCASSARGEGNCPSEVVMCRLSRTLSWSLHPSPASSPWSSKSLLFVPLCLIPRSRGLCAPSRTDQAQRCGQQ